MGCSSLLHTWASSPFAVVEGLAAGGVAQPRGQCTRAPMLRLLDPGHVGAHRARVAAIPSSTTRKTTRRGRGSNSVHLAFVAPGIGQRGGREGEGGWSLRSTGEEEGPTSLAPLPPSLLSLCCSSVSLAPPAPLNPSGHAWQQRRQRGLAWPRSSLVPRARLQHRSLLIVEWYAFEETRIAILSHLSPQRQFASPVSTLCCSTCRVGRAKMCLPILLESYAR